MRLRGEVVTIDLSAAPDLKPWAEAKLLPVCEQWYPRIAKMLPSDGFAPPAHVVVRFRDDLPKGVPAWTQGDVISCNTRWFRGELDREAVGAVVHEMTHVVQHYGHARHGHAQNPGWLVEGVADYVRWFQYEPQTHGADVRNAADAKYDASYRVTAAFLDWVTRTREPKIVPELNAVMRQGTYDEGVWKKLTGKSAAELGEEWKRSIGADDPKRTN